jgi:hypothetical protein
MSIIYDALKRIEKKTKDTEYGFDSRKRDTRKSRRLGCILLILLILCLVALFVDKSSTKKYFIKSTLTDKHTMYPKVSRITMTGKEKTPAKVVPLSAPKAEPPTTDKKLPLFYLNGIFFSDGEYLALINDQLVQTGGFIEGAQVQKIDSEGVDIKFGESSFRLSYP